MLDKKTKDLLPAIIRDTMEAITLMTNAPDEMTLPVALAVANFATQGLTNVHPATWVANVALSEYFVVLVPSGGMKTSISEMLLKGMRKFEREQEPIAAQEMVDYKIAIKKFNKSVDEEVKSPTLVKLKEPVKPRGCRHRVEKATVNGLINTLERVPFAGLFSSDAGEFFSSHSFQDTNKSIEMVSTLSKAWSGEDLDRVTGIEDNNVRLHDRRFNMLVMLQQELAGFLNNSQFKDQGFTNRMLITQCELFEKVEIIDANHRDNIEKLMTLLDPFNDRVYDLLDSVKLAQENARKMPLTLPGNKISWQDIQRRTMLLEQIGPNELILPTMMISKQAEPIAYAYYNKLRIAMRDKKYLEYANFMSRAYEHCVRLAATLTAFELKTEIGVDEFECAIGLTEYFIEQRLNMTVDGAQKISPIVELANKVHVWLMKRPNCEATKSELGAGPLRNTDEDLRAKVCQEMESRDMIKIIPIESKGTKPKNIYKGVVL